VGVASSSPLFDVAAINSSTVSSNLSNIAVIVDYASTTGAYKPMVLLGDDVCQVSNCRFDFNYSRTGTGNAIAVVAGATMSLTDGETSFQTSEVGQYITITGATDPLNNGRFLIVARPYTDTIHYVNPNGVAQPSYTGAWYIVPEAITCIKTGTGDSIASTSGSEIKTLTDAAGLFTKNDVGKTLVIYGATSPAHNGEFQITAYNSATSISYVNNNVSISTGSESFGSGKWFIVGTKSTIQNNYFRNRSSSYTGLTNVSYAGLTKKEKLPLTTGLAQYGAPDDIVTGMPSGSLDGSEPGWFFYPPVGISPWTWTAAPIWVTRDSASKLSFPLKLAPKTTLQSIVVSIKKEGVGATASTVSLVSWQGLLSNNSSTTTTIGLITINNVSGGLFNIANLEHAIRPDLSYYILVFSGVNNAYVEGLTDVTN
jgi:hypothetical protein